MAHGAPGHPLTRSPLQAGTHRVSGCRGVRLRVDGALAGPQVRLPPAAALAVLLGQVPALWPAAADRFRPWPAGRPGFSAIR